jgi:gluconokinase
MEPKNAKGLILMGVSGSGKTTIGERLAKLFDWEFFDADDFHPAENIQKMASGIPLNDSDRLPWLKNLQNLLSTTIKNGKNPILACSALKNSYRDLLLTGNEGVKIVYLKGSYELILDRMQNRKGHYMKANMLKSQFDLLEEPTDGLVVDIQQQPDEILKEIISIL